MTMRPVGLAEQKIPPHKQQSRGSMLILTEEDRVDDQCDGEQAGKPDQRIAHSVRVQIFGAWVLDRVVVFFCSRHGYDLQASGLDVIRYIRWNWAALPLTARAKRLPGQYP